MYIFSERRLPAYRFRKIFFRSVVCFWCIFVVCSVAMARAQYVVPVCVPHLKSVASCAVLVVTPCTIELLSPW